MLQRVRVASFWSVRFDSADVDFVPEIFRIKDDLIMASSNAAISLKGMRETQDTDSAARTIVVGGITVSQTKPEDDLNLEGGRLVDSGRARPYALVIGPKAVKLSRDPLALSA